MATAAELQILIKAKDDASRSLDQIGRKSEGLGAKLRKLAPYALGAGAALGGLGFAAIKFGGDFEDAYNAIRIGTGATGEDLEDLKDTARDVFSSIPASMGQSAKAVADFNTLMGLSGENLRDATTAALEAARLTGEEAESVVSGAAKAFNLFEVQGEDAADAMDALFVASQSTGAPISKLTGLLESQGSALKALGFSFEESVAFLGQMDKGGVNASRAMMALNMGTRHLAESGVTDLKQGLFDVLQEIKDAPNETEALNAAMETFGARGANAMVTAVRSGRFELEELTSQMENSSGTIEQTAEDTMKFSDRLTILKDKALVKLEPVLIGVVDGLERLTEWIETRVIPALQSWSQEHGPAVEASLQGMAAGLDTVLKASRAFGDWLTEHKEAIVAAIVAIGAAFAWSNPLVAVLIGAGGVVFALGLFRQSIDSLPEPLLKLRGEIDRVVIKLAETADTAIQVADVISTAGFDLIPGWKAAGDEVQGKLADIRQSAETDLRAVQEEIDRINTERAVGQLRTMEQQFGRATAAARAFQSAIAGLIGAGVPWSAVLSYQSGGVVPGPVGQAQLAVVHGGERIIPTRGSRTVSTPGGGHTLIDNRMIVYGRQEFVFTQADPRAAMREWDRAARGL